MIVAPGIEVDTPELDRASELNQPREPNYVLTDFIDWLGSKGYLIAHYGEVKERSRTCPRCRGTGFDGSALTPRDEQLLRAGQLRDEDREPCPTCGGKKRVWEEYRDENSLQPLHMDPERLLADHFGLDLTKMDNEKLAILEALRA